MGYCIEDPSLGLALGPLGLAYRNIGLSLKFYKGICRDTGEDKTNVQWTILAHLINYICACMFLLLLL